MQCFNSYKRKQIFRNYLVWDRNKCTSWLQKYRHRHFKTLWRGDFLETLSLPAPLPFKRPFSHSNPYIWDHLFICPDTRQFKTTVFIPAFMGSAFWKSRNWSSSIFFCFFFMMHVLVKLSDTYLVLSSEGNFFLESSFTSIKEPAPEKYLDSWFLSDSGNTSLTTF